MDFVAEEPKDEEDETLGTEEIRSSFNIWITRYNVAAIEKSLNSNKRWLVLISISGMSEDIIVYFNSETSANALHERLVKWRFDK